MKHTAAEIFAPEDRLAAHEISIIRSGDQGQLGDGLRDRIRLLVTLEIHDYWQRLRSGRPVADRALIDPVDIKRVLPHLLLLDGEGEPPRFRYRLVGTAIRKSRLGLAVSVYTYPPSTRLAKQPIRSARTGDRAAGVSWPMPAMAWKSAPWILSAVS